MDIASGLGRGMLEIAGALIGISLIALLISRSSDTSKVIGSATSGFNALLRTVTLQNQFGAGGNFNF
jgi:hypothetical protein